MQFQEFTVIVTINFQLRELKQTGKTFEEASAEDVGDPVHIDVEGLQVTDDILRTQLFSYKRKVVY